MSDYFNKGKFEKINDGYIDEGMELFNLISAYMKKYGKTDIDTCFNEFHDSYIGRLFGYSDINTSKHGFDVKDRNSDTFLESKVVSYSSNSWNATFNDTTIDKCEYFSNDNAYLAVSVWKSLNECYCVCYGQLKNITDFLAEKVKYFLDGNSMRSTQTISMIKFVKDYDFVVYSVDNNKERLYEELCLKSRGWKSVPKDRIRNINEFVPTV